MDKSNEQFSFEISLSVLNHLGRNLYRSFMTVLGEAISNSWDADAENVWIYIDKDNNSLVIKDDGDGMDSDSFQGKFLKIGYSKRKSGVVQTEKGRPFIGRKGIGKLALLSCAEKISVITKTIGNEYVGGVIDNSGLDQAITDDLTPKEYPLGEVQFENFVEYTTEHDKGTIIYFENIKDGIRNSIEYLKKLIALYFRFALLDDSFTIWVDDEIITIDQLDDLASNTQFLWIINELIDPFVTEKLLENVLEERPIRRDFNIEGFIASVDKPRNLKITSTEEKIGVDLFVNGRLREKDILKHIPTARIVESYLYGQIHFNELDSDIDRFTSSREGVVADDSMFKELLDDLKIILSEILEDWDIWRIKHKKPGDSENPRISSKERASRELFNVVSEEYSLPDDSTQRDKVIEWVESLEEDAQFNFSSYAECFISENLMRKYIQEKDIALSPAEQNVVTDFRNRERNNKIAGNINIDLRQNDDDLSYLDMTVLTKVVDPQRGNPNTLTYDAKEYKPIRDALAHTALLTTMAKTKLTTIYENMKGRIKILLSE